MYTQATENMAAIAPVKNSVLWGVFFLFQNELRRALGRVHSLKRQDHTKNSFQSQYSCQKCFIGCTSKSTIVRLVQQFVNSKIT